MQQTGNDLFEGWTTYEKVVAGDYMHQQVYFAGLLQEVQASLPNQSLAILDLGCGDAQPILPLLRRYDISAYTGVDDSDSALVQAADRLSEFADRVTLVQSDMRDIHHLGQFDLITASYSLHHLQLKEKQEMLGRCQKMLKPGGLLAVIDVFRQEQEVLSDYHQRWADYAEACYVSLDPDELDELISHVKGSDLPETQASYLEMAASAGLELKQAQQVGDEKLNAMMIFSRSTGE